MTREQMTGGQIVAATLRELGAGTIFTVSGNQILPVYDAVADFGLRLIHMRHESAAAYAAAASAELGGRPGVLLVSAGPGYLAALTGVATARSLELPLLFLSGACATTDAGAGGFQDLDQRGISRALCKAAMEVSSVGQIGPTLLRAWRLAQDGVPGPVHVSLPADVLIAVSREGTRGESQPPAVEVIPADESILEAMAQRLMQAKRPLLVARPSAGRGAAGKALRALARQLGVQPVITECPRGRNDLKYREVIRHYRDSDCALVVAPADFAVGFLAEPVIASAGSVLHIDAPGDPRPRRVVDLHTRVPAEIALSYLVEATAGHRPHLAHLAEWSFPRSDETPVESSPEGLHPLGVAKEVRELLEPEDIVVLDGGEFCQWIRLGLGDLPNRMLWNSKLGGIGGGIPMALGIAATGHPGRTVVFLGDGTAGYHASEFETAVRYAIPFVAIVGNDARWGAEWHMQASRYGPERTFATNLLPARYDQVAIGLGAAGFHITDAESLRAALSASLYANRPACLNVQILSAPSPAAPV
ncbi:MAG: thiamine pyrophosphate-binding protein [Blastocatellia bacterium]